MNFVYRSSFYSDRKELAKRSAGVIFDYLFKYIKPKNVVDFGCATGIWLSELEGRGVDSVLGVDGPWVPKSLMEIDLDDFVTHDLSKIKLSLEGSFDLALCIEVAEHLPSSKADDLVGSLVDSSECIMFSAAIPGQGGVGHVNEQPQSYWAKKFQDRGYSCIDYLRPLLWDDERVNVIYKQNLLIYVRQERVEALKLGKYLIHGPYDLNRIHPELFRLRQRRKFRLIRKFFSTRSS